MGQSQGTVPSSSSSSGRRTSPREAVLTVPKRVSPRPGVATTTSIGHPPVSPPPRPPGTAVPVAASAPRSAAVVSAAPVVPVVSTTTTNTATTTRKHKDTKILLLGAGDSGKSTLVKQMHVIHLQGFSPAQKREYRPVVFQYVLQSMAGVLAHCPAEVTSLEAARRVTEMERRGDAFPETSAMPAQLGADLKALWGLQEVRKSQMDHASEIGENTLYYLEALDRLASQDYVPTDQDIVCTPSHTTGFAEVVFQLSDEDRYVVVDVGGQRSERRKWVETFQGVSAVIFCAPLSEYDQRLYEDRQAGRLQESLKLWKDVSSSKWFARSALFLFLNKRDVFVKKVTEGRPPFAQHLTDYRGPPNDPVEAARHLRELYLAQCPERAPTVQCYETCATDSDDIRNNFLRLQEHLHKVLPTLRAHRH